MTSAERNTSTADRSVREAVIRDLYALVAFYVAHPEHPLPDSMHVYHHADLAGVQDVAEAYGTLHGVYGDKPQTDHNLRGTSIPIAMIVSVPSGKKVDEL